MLSACYFAVKIDAHFVQYAHWFRHSETIVDKRNGELAKNEISHSPSFSLIFLFQGVLSNDFRRIGIGAII